MYSHNYFKVWSNNSDISVITEFNFCGYFISADYSSMPRKKKCFKDFCWDPDISHRTADIVVNISVFGYERVLIDSLLVRDLC